MRALVIQQDHVSPTGPVGERLVERGYDIEEFLVVPADRFDSPDVDVDFPDPLAYDLVVPMGAVWSVYDAAAIGWVHDELELLRRAHEAGVPVLGICFGGQALATALGGTVERAPETELGWVSVTTAEPSLLEPGPWFQWHDDRWTAPPGSRELARTAIAPQAFVSGRSMGVQFHPELVTSQLEGWLDNDGRRYLLERGLDPEVLLTRTRAEEPAAVPRTRRLVDRFLDAVAVADPAAVTSTSGRP